MTTSCVAAALHISRRRVYQLIESGRLPATSTDLGWAISSDDVKNFKPRGRGRPRLEIRIIR